MATTNTIVTETSVTKRRPMKPWDKDGINGGPSSLSVVMTWLTKPANFSRWEGSKDENSSCTRESLCSEINRLLMKRGIKHRNNRDIRNRIQNIYYGYKKAQNWIDENEQITRNKLLERGVPADQLDLVIEDKVKGIFFSYYIMEPLMNGNYTLEPYDATISESSDGFISGEEDEKQQQTPSPPYTQESTPIPQSHQQIEEEEKSLSIRRTPSPFTQFKVTKRKPYQRVIRRKGIYSILARYMQEKVEIEKERFEFEKSQAVTRAPIRQAEAQVAFINSWKSLGLSNEEILSKIAEIWK